MANTTIKKLLHFAIRLCAVLLIVVTLAFWAILFAGASDFIPAEDFVLVFTMAFAVMAVPGIVGLIAFRLLRGR